MSKKLFRRICAAALVAAAFVTCRPAAGAAPAREPLPVQLAAAGRPLFPVVVAPGAGELTRAAAADLAAMLERISGAPFAVVEGDGRTGLAVGTGADFPALGLNGLVNPGPFGREDYLLRGHAHGFYLVGATELAVQHAVWDFLHRLGYRYFFPSPAWEIIPALAEPVLAVDTLERPAFHVRGVGGTLRLGRAPALAAETRRWQVRNRAVSAFQLHTSHAWQAIIRRHRAVFDENPQYLALVDGRRGGGRGDKFCVSNPDLLRLVIDDVLARVDENTDSISLEPSDGGDHCECEPCARLGSVSDQVVTLANLAAAALEERFPAGDKFVGIYAYNWHSPPPSIAVHPNVIVSLESTHLRHGTTLENMLAGWGERVARLGKREAYARSYTSSSGFLPGGSRGSDLPYIQRTLAEWHAHGVRFLRGGGNAHWGLNGLGYYVVARLLWDVREAADLDELVEDFLQRAFGPAAGEMRGYFAAINRATADPLVPGRGLPVDRRIGRMYRALDAARAAAAGDRAIVARIDDLVLYTRFVDLYRRARVSQADFDALVAHAWRMRGRHVTDTVNLLAYLNRFVVGQRESIAWPEGGGRFAPGRVHREKEDVPFGEAEILAMLAQGREAYPPVDIAVEAVAFGGELVPAGFESDAPRGEPVFHGREGHRGALVLHLWAADGRLPVLRFSGGHCWPGRGPLRWELFDPRGEPVQSGEIPAEVDPPRQGIAGREAWAAADYTHELSLVVPDDGVYRFALGNTNQGFFWDYQPREGAGLVIRADPRYPLAQQWLGRHYFYVPAGLEEIAVAGRLREGRSTWLTPAGEPVPADQVRGAEEGFSIITVPPGDDGRVWSFTTRSDRPALRFLNVPGFLAFHPRELVVPRELAGERP